MSDDNNEYGFGNGASYSSNQNANVSFGDSGSPATNAAATVKDISTAEFATEVIEASMSVPVLVDFWAPWCGPCKQLAPALEKAVAATNGKVRLVKMDIDQHPEVAGQMGIQSIPAVVAFVGGKPADAFMGAKPEGEIREFIAKVAGPVDTQADQIEMLLGQAAELAESGQIGEAGNIYGQILSMDPENLKAISSIGHLYVREDNLEGAKGLLANLEEKQLASEEIKSLLSAIELAEQAQSLGEYAELESTVNSNPDDHQTRLDLAIALNAAGRREDAADHLLEIMKRQPGWNDDAARVQLLQFFEAWGMTDEITISARRKLSSLLFS